MKAMKSESKEVLLVVLQKRDYPLWSLTPERPSIAAPGGRSQRVSSCLAPSKRERLELVALAGRSGWERPW
ncbi:hypothetical protein DY000_02004715 [Brassica cretica]|uniref:Uncharacterized protein n=1 Tax=Brassica cretica TaxID=69181 RepID=A0ABQ7BSS7_BRACR|nr:hypothetical protein DY000_02004715 [Brassica cretica]